MHKGCGRLWTAPSAWGPHHPHLGINMWTTRRMCGPLRGRRKLSTDAPSCPHRFPPVRPHRYYRLELGERELSPQSTPPTVTAVLVLCLEEEQNKSRACGWWGQLAQTPDAARHERRCAPSARSDAEAGEALR